MMLDTEMVAQKTGAQRVAELFLPEYLQPFLLIATFGHDVWVGASSHLAWTTDEAIGLIWDTST